MCSSSSKLVSYSVYPRHPLVLGSRLRTRKARCCPPTPLAGLFAFLRKLPLKKRNLCPAGFGNRKFRLWPEFRVYISRVDSTIFQQRIVSAAQERRAAKQRAPWVSSTRSFSSPCSCWWAFCTRPTRATRCDRLHNLPPFTASSPFPLTETDPTPPPGTSFRRREGPGVQPHRRGRGMAHILGDLLSLHRH